MVQVGIHAVAVAKPVLPEIPGALRVLIADYNALNQNLLKRPLVMKLGHSADVVSNGREAVAAVAQEPYDALLMDVLMPETTNLQRPKRSAGAGRAGAGRA